MKLKAYDVGVIVGRFQIAELHDAHLNLINEVIDRHKKCVIVVGTTSTLGTKQNPLDFSNRFAMINSVLNINDNKNIIISPLSDQKCDVEWSDNLDDLIRSIHPNSSVCLYGGRDSFIKYYHGNFDCYEFPSHDHRPATQIRNEIGKEIINSIDFRKGVVYSTQNNYPNIYPAVDVAVMEDDQHVLLGRKKFEKQFRFFGGFVNPNETLNQACVREVKEETCLNIEGIRYVDSKVIDDWRYRSTNSSILSMFHVAYDKKDQLYMPYDDIIEIKKVNVFEIDYKKRIVEEHHYFYECLIEYLKYESSIPTNKGDKNE